MNSPSTLNTTPNLLFLLIAAKDISDDSTELTEETLDLRLPLLEIEAILLIEDVLPFLAAIYSSIGISSSESVLIFDSILFKR
jgi:hypothetical protein